MGLLIREDIRWRAMGCKGFENEAGPGGFDAGRQLSVRKSAGAAFSELHIAFRIQDAFFLKAFNILNALTDGMAAVDQQRTGAGPGQDQRGEQTGRPGSYHQRTLFPPPADIRKLCLHRSRRDAMAPASKQQVLPVRFYIQRENEMHVVLVPCVNGLSGQADLPDGFRTDPETLRDELWPFLRPGIQRRFDILQSDQGCSSSVCQRTASGDA